MCVLACVCNAVSLKDTMAMNELPLLMESEHEFKCAIAKPESIPKCPSHSNNTDLYMEVHHLQGLWLSQNLLPSRHSMASQSC
jgi:hypothetical protein